jgi:hypothetical protein
MAVNTAGRKRKEANKSNNIQEGIVVIPPHSLTTPLISIDEGDEASNVQVMNPVPPSGLKHLIDSEGEAVSESVHGSLGEVAQKEVDAKKLISIQRKVGFTFDIEEEELQSRLVELDEVDRVKNVERVQDMGHQ